MITYRGNCHCGDFVFEVSTLEPISVGYVCNCSICYKKGYVYHIMKNGKDGAKVGVVKGSLDQLASYTFGRKHDYKFCAKCGSGPVVTEQDDPNGMAINVRCLQDAIDLLPTLKMIPFDGASLPPVYVEPDYFGPEPAGGPVGDEPSKIYHGSCHCGAVRMSLRSKPLETLDPTGQIGHIVDCNCSICIRGGYIWIYPTKDQSAVQGEDNLTHYSFANHVDRKSFCRTCGVHLFNIGVEYTLEEEAALPVVARSETARTGREECRDERNINTRVLHGVDVNKLPVHYLDGNGDMEPQYVNP